jgi:Recombinase zinc beta ribbon domain/Recombinase
VRSPVRLTRQRWTLKPSSLGPKVTASRSARTQRLGVAAVPVACDLVAIRRRCGPLTSPRPDPETAHVVRWIFARRLAGHSVARIARALNDAGIPCPSAADPGRNPHRTGAGWTLSAVTSRKPAHPALVSEADFIAAQDISAARGPASGAGLAAPRKRRYLLAGLLECGGCGRRMESAWSNGKAAYRCRHGHTTASRRGHGRLKNAYIREDRILPHPPSLHLQLTEPAAGQRMRRTRRGVDVRYQPTSEDVTGYLRERRDHSHLRSGLRHPGRRNHPGHHPDSKLIPASAAGSRKEEAGIPPVTRRWRQPTLG